MLEELCVKKHNELREQQSSKYSQWREFLEDVEPLLFFVKAFDFEDMKAYSLKLQAMECKQALKAAVATVNESADVVLSYDACTDLLDAWKNVEEVIRSELDEEELEALHFAANNIMAHMFASLKAREQRPDGLDDIIGSLADLVAELYQVPGKLKPSKKPWLHVCRLAKHQKPASLIKAVV